MRSIIRDIDTEQPERVTRVLVDSKKERWTCVYGIILSIVWVTAVYWVVSR